MLWRKSTHFDPYQMTHTSSMADLTRIICWRISTIRGSEVQPYSDNVSPSISTRMKPDSAPNLTT
ncbi:hypothetical protein ES319_A06G116700v1 [Gossypium barbadense]|uniref:Uncharacterized protein n=2 Tax=Gossypium TaxID=3633 RepID=A0A5J5VD46_GOSBA|nr:hypothetical protein ES319_A06G116700v1 [Gossypium barbadense]KAB2077709.1 hypothetical protein ES319_A06G116700v1 [Gossypium barbadense]KAB2077712.1 hypothetical protein ES319_A06G116700v1 [Gossypium barbadense]TYH13284.1 hypothetical protein ES288_A06G130700v1 [Gossypium darwinii]